MALKTEGKQNYGKMTFQEKRINRNDLDHYKKYENSVNAMIPGINNLSSVGSRPLRKGAISQLYYGKGPTDVHNQEKGAIFAE